MPHATVNVGSDIDLTARFYAYRGGPLADPDSGPTVDITYEGVSVLDAPAVYPGDIRKDADGVFTYTYHVPGGSPTGTYTATWSFTEGEEDRVGTEHFDVVRSEIILDNTGESLGADFEINYMTVVTPAFLDPDEIMVIFPQADRSAVMESIHRISLEIQAMYPGVDPENLPPLMYQYLVAAVACDISQRYGYNTSDAKSITLGDLSVSYETSEGEGNNNNDGLSWCEIAANLKQDLKLANIAPMKGVVKGARIRNPIPSRSIGRVTKYPYGKGY